MSDRLVKFIEKTNTYKIGKDPVPDVYLIDPEKVGLVSPRSDYTTLVVQGLYFHVQGTRDEVLSKLGFEVSTRE